MKVIHIGHHPAVWCPACDTHHLFDSRWKFNGDMEKPTFTPSMLSRMGECTVKGIDYDNYRCHSFVTDGKIKYLSDCSHELAGQEIELQHIEE